MHSARSSRLADFIDARSSAKARSQIGLLLQPLGNPSCAMLKPIVGDCSSMKSAKSTTSALSGAIFSRRWRMMSSTPYSLLFVPPSTCGARRSSASLRACPGASMSTSNARFHRRP